MTDLLLYLAATIIGYFIGAGLKKRGRTWTWVGRLQTLVIIVLVFLMRRAKGFDRYGRRGEARAAAEAKAADCDLINNQSENNEAIKLRLNSLTLIIVVFVAVGIASGYLFLPDGFIAATGTLLTITLSVLLVLVGIDIGTEGTLAVNFKSAGWRVVVFPFVSIASMILGSVIASLLLPAGCFVNGRMSAIG